MFYLRALCGCGHEGGVPVSLGRRAPVLNVRFGSKAGVEICIINVGFAL
jgi:hypothetical protein